MQSVPVFIYLFIYLIFINLYLNLFCIYIYAFMKTMCPPGHHHNAFAATHALRQMMYGV